MGVALGRIVETVTMGSYVTLLHSFHILHYAMTHCGYHHVQIHVLC
jgi:hypothetical protein